MKFFISMLIVINICSLAIAQESPPWGSAEASTMNYAPQKVLYDLTAGSEKKINNILDRASLLNKLYNNDPFDASIVIIIHGSAIPFFAKNQFEEYKALMQRAHNLQLTTRIEYRMCQASAKLQGFSPADIHGFINMVPMADAEIIKLQNEEGYAYMR